MGNSTRRLGQKTAAEALCIPQDPQRFIDAVSDAPTAITGSGCVRPRRGAFPNNPMMRSIGPNTRAPMQMHGGAGTLEEAIPATVKQSPLTTPRTDGRSL